MAVVCTKSIPEPRVTPGPPMAPCITDFRYTDHKMRSDIPKMCGASLDEYDFETPPFNSKYFVADLLAVHPLHPNFLTRR